MADDDKGKGVAAGESEGPEQMSATQAGGRPLWRELFRRALVKAERESRPSDRTGLGEDRSRSLFLLVGVAIAVVLLVLVLFSSPDHHGEGRQASPHGTAGKGLVPGEQTPVEQGSTAPLLSAQMNPSQDLDAGQVTPSDVNNTARPIARSPAPDGKGAYALGRIDLSDLDARERPSSSTASQQPDDLKKPSLVFVRKSSTPAEGPSAQASGREVQPVLSRLGLPAGSRLLARLDSATTSALRTPVVATIEYNYEQSGEIVVPAGAKVLGRMEQADASGYVAIHFHSIQMPDGTTDKLDATAVSLTYGPLKGVVSGKKTGTNLVVRTFSGLGQAATYLVGSGGLSAPLSEGAFVRDRAATNIGIAGDQELNRLAFNQHIVVTVPGNTRFYVVTAQDTSAGEDDRETAPVRGEVLPSVEELRELLELQRELGGMVQQQGSAQTTSEPPSPQ